MQPAVQNSLSPVISLDAELLRKLLPHREPMLMLDSIEACWPAEGRGVALKHVTADDPVVQGYDREGRIFPPVLVIEALAQCSGVVMRLARLAVPPGPGQVHWQEALASAESPPMSVLAESKIRHFQLAHPGDTLRLESRLQLKRARMYLFQVRATVGELEIAHGELLLGMSSP